MNTKSAISQHGAAAVYAAAHRHSGGDTARGLASVGLSAKTMADVWAIMSEAHAAMTDAERAIEAADASATLATKRPAHRPVTIDARRVNVTLDDETIERAKALGGGNLSAGLREAVRRAG